MDKYMKMLGYKFEDRVTGFAGVADSVSFDLYGCVQVSIMPPAVITDKGSEQPTGRWDDVARLKQTSENRVMEVPTFERITSKPVPDVTPGPASKSPRT